MVIENKKKVIKIVKSTMEKMNIRIDESDYYNSLGWENGYRVEYLENEKLIDGKEKNVYVVRFNGQDYEKYDENGESLHFMEGQKFTAYLDENLKLLFIIGNHGILDINIT